MKKRAIRMLSILLAVVMLLGNMPLSAFAAEERTTTDAGESMTISASSAKSMAGSTVDVTILVEGNPGISSVKLNVAYGDILTLESVTYNTAMGGIFQQPQTLGSPVVLNWASPTAEYSQDGIFATLKFAVSEEAETGSVSEIKISYDPDDIYNMEEENIDNIVVVNGSVTVIKCQPGDINGDQKVNNKDFTRLFQYLSDWDVEVSETCLDVNNDGNINNKDFSRLFQYLSGWDVEIYCACGSAQKCDHALELIPYKAATCEAEGNVRYYNCTACGKNYSDDKGSKELQSVVIPKAEHTLVVDPYVEPTYDSVGWEEGSHCSVCGYVAVAQVEIPKLEKTTVNISYVYEGKSPGAFLKSYVQNNDISKFNPNDTEYNTALKGYIIDPLTDVNAVPGYEFMGWYDGDGNRVTSIAKGEERNIKLYAKWQILTYWITFDSGKNGPEALNIPNYADSDLKDIPDSSVHYTVEMERPLSRYNPELFQHTFVGWSNDDGFLIDKIPIGTTGNMTVHANWTSNRNRATSYQSYGEPIIIEDAVRGQILFVYNIGRIDNVPLNEGDYLGYFEKLDATMSYETQSYMDKEDTERINEMIALATTQSSGWTLSKDWNEIYGTSEETGSLLEKTKERTDTRGNTVGGEYFVSNSEGGSSHMSTESGGSWSNSSKITTDDSWGLNSSIDVGSEMYCDAQLGVKTHLGASNTLEASAGVEVPVKIAKVSAGVKNTTTVEGSIDTEMGVQNGRKDTMAYHSDSSESHYVGTVNSDSAAGYYNSAMSATSNWNSTTGYTKSNSIHNESSVTDVLKEQIQQNTTHNVEKSTGSSEENTFEKQNTSTNESEYGTSTSIRQGTSEKVTESKHLIGTNEGHYRMVPMGTFHVFGIVGYDIATDSYFTHCYNVQDDTIAVQLDYSRDRATFDDCQNGEVNFKIPYEISEYVAGFVGKTNGLEISYDGVVTGFEPSEVYLKDGTKKEFDGTIVVPMYEGKDDLNGEYTAVKVTSFTKNAFKQVKDSVETIVLPTYITKIPDHAFEGFTNLKTVIAYGVTEIGDYAFAGCTSLEKFYVDTAITSLGENAFKDVVEISVAAYDSKVAEAAIKSGAKRITVNISYIKDNFNNREVNVPDSVEYFALIGKSASNNDVAYSNLRVESQANETMINGIKFVDNADTPIKLGSQKVTLAKVTVDNSPGFAMILTADSAEVRLLDTVTLNTNGENAILSKNVTLDKAVQSTTSKIITNGRYLVCGEVANKDNYLNVVPVQITSGEFEKYLDSHVVTFDPGNGTIAESEKTKKVYYGQVYGQMPTPTRESYAFDGWFTAADGGEKVTADMIVDEISDHTLYAHWTLKDFTVTFNANGGTVGETTRTVTCGKEFGALPVPARDGHTFDGWYDANGNKVTEKTTKMTAENMTVTAKWILNEYKVSWNAGTGYSITVSRTSSPVAGAATGTLNSGDKIYYGDVLSVSYGAATGYSLESKGNESITVTGNVTETVIFATATPNEYTYNIVCKSSNGTALSTSTVSHTFGTTNSITPPAIAGYDTPAAQSVVWDSADAKTITFSYEPTPVRPTTKSGYVSNDTYYKLKYDVTIDYRNRTANSVQIQVTWKASLSGKGAYNNYGQWFRASAGSASTGNVNVVKQGTWGAASSDTRTGTGASGWITVPLNTTNATSVNLSVYYYQANYNGTDITPQYAQNMSATWAITIPAY